jgi:hypothetical protein
MPELDFPQIIGIVAFLIGATAFLHQDGHKFRLHLTVFQMVLCSHFILMGAVTAAIGCGISALRSYASTRTQSSIVMCFFIGLLWVMGLPNVEHSYEVLTIFGASVATWSLFKAQGIHMRLLILFNSFCWLTNNLLLGSIGGTMMEATFIIVNAVTIYKMYRTSKQIRI